MGYVVTSPFQMRSVTFRSSECEDPNRETKADGSCDSDCKDGYEYVGIDGEDYPTSMCVDDPMNYDPNDCASKNRHTVADYECGGCKTRYVEDSETGNCVAEEREGMNALKAHMKEYGVYYGIGLVALMII